MYNYFQVFRAMCSKDELLKSFGSSIVTLSSANSYSYEKRDITFETYANEMMGPQKLETLANGELWSHYSFWCKTTGHKTDHRTDV